MGVETGGNRVAKVALLELDERLVQEVEVWPAEVTLQASICDCASDDCSLGKGIRPPLGRTSVED